MTKWEETYGKFSDLASIYNGRKGIDWQDETLGQMCIRDRTLSVRHEDKGAEELPL